MRHVHRSALRELPGTLKTLHLHGVGNPRDRVSESFHSLLKFQR